MSENRMGWRGKTQPKVSKKLEDARKEARPAKGSIRKLKV